MSDISRINRHSLLQMPLKKRAPKNSDERNSALELPKSKELPSRADGTLKGSAKVVEKFITERSSKKD